MCRSGASRNSRRPLYQRGIPRLMATGSTPTSNRLAVGSFRTLLKQLVKTRFMSLPFRSVAEGPQLPAQLLPRQPPVFAGQGTELFAGRPAPAERMQPALLIGRGGGGR